MTTSAKTPKQTPLDQQYQQLISGISNNKGNILQTDSYLDPALSGLYSGIFNQSSNTLQGNYNSNTLPGAEFAMGNMENASSSSLFSTDPFASSTWDQVGKQVGLSNSDIRAFQGQGMSPGDVARKFGVPGSQMKSASTAQQTIQGYLNANPAMSAGLDNAKSIASLNNPDVAGIRNASGFVQGNARAVQGNANQVAEVAQQLNSQGNRVLNQQYDPHSTLGALNKTAQQQLSLGGSIDPSQQEALNQNIMGSFAGTGMLGSSAAVGSLATNTAQLSQSLLNQRMANAGNVQGLNANNAAVGGNMLSASGGLFGNAGNLNAAAGSLNATAGNLFGAAGQLQNQNQANLFGYAQMLNSPLQMMQSSFLNGTNQLGSSFLQAGMHVPMQSASVSPMTTNQMSDFFNTQFNSQASSNIANAQAQNSTMNGAIGAGTAVATTSATIAALW